MSQQHIFLTKEASEIETCNVTPFLSIRKSLHIACPGGSQKSPAQVSSTIFELANVNPRGLVTRVRMHGTYAVFMLHAVQGDATVLS